jgi:hypothetical protein
VAFRLLLGQNFGDHFGYGLNAGLEQDVSRDSGREFEVSQSVAYGAMKGKLIKNATIPPMICPMANKPLSKRLSSKARCIFSS